MGWLLSPLLVGALALSVAPACAGGPGQSAADVSFLRGGFVHLGVSAVSQADIGTLTLGGVPVPGADYVTGVTVAPSIEAGVFLDRHFALAAFATAPMTSDSVAAGTLTGLGSLGSDSAGYYGVTAQVHVPIADRLTAYLGAGVGYMHVFGTSDGAITGFTVSDGFGPVVQAGAEFRINDRYGLFLDVKSVILGTVARGTFGVAPAVAQARIDPVIVSSGLAVSF
jgi:outer membrane protein